MHREKKSIFLRSVIRSHEFGYYEPYSLSTPYIIFFCIWFWDFWTIFILTFLYIPGHTYARRRIQRTSFSHWTSSTTNAHAIQSNNYLSHWKWQESLNAVRVKKRNNFFYDYNCTPSMKLSFLIRSVTDYPYWFTYV